MEYKKEIKTERRAVKDFILKNALLSEYFDVFLFEDMSAKSKPPEAVYLEKARESDIYIGILGNKYGNAGKDKISPTEAEFCEAKKAHKNILIYIKGESTEDKKRQPEMQKFIKEIRDSKQGFTCKRFNNVENLTRVVYASLIDFLKEEGIVGRGVFDEQICTGATFSDIDEDKVRWLLRVARGVRKFPLSTKVSVKDVLVHLNLLRGEKLTNAAVLLFGKDPHRFFLQAEVKCLHLPGIEVCKPFLSYKIYSGNLFEQIDKAVGFVIDIIKQAVIQQKYTPQVRRPFEIPVFAIQEAIVNAVAHRNYNSNAGIQVMVFVDRVEVWNPGSLPSHLSIADLKKPHHSCPGNPLIAEVLYLTNYIQKAGSGTIEMINQCKVKGLPEPEFVNNRGYEFRTILGRDIFVESILIKLGLNERQLKAIKYVKNQYKITNKDYKELTGVSKPTATRDLNDLVNKQILIKYGVTGKGTVYKLKGS